MDNIESIAVARTRETLSVLESNLAGGDVEANRALLEAHPDLVRDRCLYGEFLLHWICRKAGAEAATAATVAAGAAAAAAELAVFVVSEWPQSLQERDANGLLPLHVAVQFASSNRELIQAVVAARPQAAVDRTPGGDLALHLAVKTEAPIAVVQFLVAAGPSTLLERDATGSLPLHLAAELSTLGFVELLADADPKAVREADGRGRLSLHRAAENAFAPAARWGQVRPNQRLFGVQARVGRWRPALWRQDKDGWLPLHIACRSGMTAVIGLLAREFPRAVRRRTRTEKWVPLHIMAQREYIASATAEVDRVRTMVDLWPRGLRMRDAKGWLPLHYAVRGVPLEVVQRFAWGWPPSLRTATSDTKAFPLHLVAYALYRDVELVQFLADSYPPALQTRDADGQLPLHRCVSRALSRLDKVRLLGSAFPGAFREKDSNEWLPLHHAAAHMSVEVVRYVAEEWEPGLLEPTNDGRLPLHIAAQHNAWELDVIQFLTEAAPTALRIQSNDGSLPLHLAATKARGHGGDAMVYLANASTQALDVNDSRGLKPVHVAAVRRAPLDAIYLLARMDPAASHRLGRPDVPGRASAAVAAPNAPGGRSERPSDSTAEFRACCWCAGGATPRCAIL